MSMKTSEAELTSDGYFLYQHPHRIFQGASQRLYELRRIRPDADSVATEMAAYTRRQPVNRVASLSIPTLFFPLPDFF